MAKRKFTAKTVTSKSLTKKPQFAQEAFVLVRGFVVNNDKGKGKNRFVSFQRDAKVVAFIRKQANKDTKRRLIFPK